MLNQQENKMMNAADPNDGVTFKAASGMMYDFFFPGSGKWKAVTVRAESRQVAQQLWEDQRELVNPEEATSTVASPEPTKEDQSTEPKAEPTKTTKE
jgi:hypothetical protein